MDPACEKGADVTITVEWVDSGREPRCAPDPQFPGGKDLVMAAFPEGVGAECVKVLPYPAKRCGMYIVKCDSCGLAIGITTAGRADDPRSVRLTCLRKPQ